MPTEKAIEALRGHAARVSQQKQQAVRDAIVTLVNKRHAINISSVARIAGVSREFIHKHEFLRDAVKEADRLSHEKTAPSATGVVEGHIIAGLRVEKSTLIDQVRRQKAAMAEQQMQLAELQKQQQRWLGVQLEAIEAIDPQAHAELGITNDRLVTDNTLLVRQVEELRRLITLLEADLAASRQAHMEDVASFSRPHAEVVAIRRP
jgi:hypothetical protein